MSIFASPCQRQGTPWFRTQRATICFAPQQPLLVRTWTGWRRKQMRDKKERKIDGKECKEHRLCSLGGYNYLAAAAGGTGNTISHVRRRRCCEDSPGVKCPIVTTSQCVYSLRLSVRHTCSAFAAWAPASLATSNHYERMQMPMKFQPAIYQELWLDKSRDMWRSEGHVSN